MGQRNSFEPCMEGLTMQNLFARVRLGARGPDVSRLCLSTRMFAQQSGHTEAAEMVTRFGQAGGNFIDASGDPACERIAGEAIGRHRDRWILAGTCQAASSNGARSPRSLKQGLAASLDRLETDRIDLYYLPLDDRIGRLEDMVETLGELIEAGRIGGWGFANFRAWRIAELVRIADCLDVPRPIAAQPYYHALYRLVEADYLPACAHFGIGAVAYAPLARGILSEQGGGAIRLPLPPPAPDGQADGAMVQPAALDAVRAIARHLQPSGRAMSGFALQWVLANQLVSSVVIRPGSMAHLDSYLSAAETPYTPDDEAFIDALVPSGGFIGAAFGDPVTPRTGRVLA